MRDKTVNTRGGRPSCDLKSLITKTQKSTNKKHNQEIQKTNSPKGNTRNPETLSRRQLTANNKLTQKGGNIGAKNPLGQSTQVWNERQVKVQSHWRKTKSGTCTKNAENPII